MDGLLLSFFLGCFLSSCITTTHGNAVLLTGEDYDIVENNESISSTNGDVTLLTPHDTMLNLHLFDMLRGIQQLDFVKSNSTMSKTGVFDNDWRNETKNSTEQYVSQTLEINNTGHPIKHVITKTSKFNSSTISVHKSVLRTGGSDAGEQKENMQLTTQSTDPSGKIGQAFQSAHNETLVDVPTPGLFVTSNNTVLPKGGSDFDLKKENTNPSDLRDKTVYCAIPEKLREIIYSATVLGNGKLFFLIKETEIQGDGFVEVTNEFYFVDIPSCTFIKGDSSSVAKAFRVRIIPNFDSVEIVTTKSKSKTTDEWRTLSDNGTVLRGPNEHSNLCPSSRTTLGLISCSYDRLHTTDSTRKYLVLTDMHDNKTNLTQTYVSVRNHNNKFLAKSQQKYRVKAYSTTNDNLTICSSLSNESSNNICCDRLDYELNVIFNLTVDLWKNPTDELPSISAMALHNVVDGGLLVACSISTRNSEILLALVDGTGSNLKTNTIVLEQDGELEKNNHVKVLLISEKDRVNQEYCFTAITLKRIATQCRKLSSLF